MSNVTKVFHLTLLLVAILVISSCGQQEPQVVVASRTAYDFMVQDIPPAAQIEVRMIGQVDHSFFVRCR